MAGVPIFAALMFAIISFGLFTAVMINLQRCEENRESPFRFPPAPN